MGWPTVTEIKSVLTAGGFDATVIPDSLYQLILDGFVAQIEHVTGKQFVADTTATELRFNGTGNEYIVTRDFVELDEIRIYLNYGLTEEYKVLDATEYYVEDTNPMFAIQARNYFNTPIVGLSYSGFGIFPRGRKNIGVVAKWGYSVDVPDDLKAFVLEKIANQAKIYSTLSSTTGQLKTWKEADVTETYNTMHGELVRALATDSVFKARIQSYKDSISKHLLKRRHRTLM